MQFFATVTFLPGCGLDTNFDTNFGRCKVRVLSSMAVVQHLSNLVISPKTWRMLRFGLAVAMLKSFKYLLILLIEDSLEGRRLQSHLTEPAVQPNGKTEGERLGA